MAKDPAFLFYSSDFLTGVSNLTMEERGQYITLLCLQHQTGHLSEKTIRLTIGSVSVDVMSKFSKDTNGLFFNQRLDEESEKRKIFINSRIENGRRGGRPKNDEPLGKPLALASANLPEDENEDVNSIIKGVVDFLNFICGKDFKPTTPKTKSVISARLKDGFSVKEIESVITNRFKEWGNDPKMKEYLRPETLFGNKFEGYLQVVKDLKPKTEEKHAASRLPEGFKPY
jgi:uncharacterized phage protein (TIGR02220 family)